MNLRRLACAVALAGACAGSYPVEARAQDVVPPSPPVGPPAGSPTEKPLEQPNPTDANSVTKSSDVGVKGAAESPRETDSREQSRVDAELTLRRSVVPEPISPDRFAAMLTAIDPALATNKDIAEQYALYRTVLARIAQDPGRRILQLIPAAYNFDGSRGVFEPRPTPTLIELLALRDRAARDAADAEKALFRAISLATPIDLRAKLAFERIAEINLRLPRAGMLASTSVSMREILDRARLSEASRAVLQSTVLAYADALTALSLERARILLEGDAARAAIESEAGLLWRYGTGERVASIEEQLDRVDELEFSSELAIRDAHLALLRRLRSTLPRPEGRRVIEQWQRATHPELFDDERILAQLVESVVSRPELDAETQTAVLDALDATYVKLEPLSDAASSTADRILPRLAERSNDSVRAEIAARLDLLELQRKRRILVKDALARIRGIAGGAPAETLLRFEDLAQTIAALERADRAERTSLEALDAEVAAKPQDEAIAPVLPGETTPSTQNPTSKPSTRGTTTPSTSPTKSTSETSGGTNSNRGRGGRGSRNPIND